MGNHIPTQDPLIDKAKELIAQHRQEKQSVLVNQ